MTRPSLRSTALMVLVLTAHPAAGQGPADPLLKLVPPDAGVTLAVEDLKGHSREVLASPLAAGLAGLPAFQRWRGSDDFAELRRTVKRVEAVLGEDLSTLRDGLFGEAVVLTLWVPPGRGPESARGMLLVKVPDRALLDRLGEKVNASLSKDGALRRVTERTHAGAKYHVREFAAGNRETEYYARLGDRVFAWSNSEDLLRATIDRNAGGASGLSQVPAFAEVRKGLPANPAASLFVDPKFIQGLLAGTPTAEKPQERRLLALLGQYLSALRYAGLAVEWRDGVRIHTHELLEPERLGPSLKRWAAASRAGEPALARVPASALAVVNAGVDLAVALDVFLQIVPDADRVKFDTLLVAVRGLMLGMDPVTEVLPKLGPGASAYLDRPGPDGKPPVVLAFKVAPGPDGAKAAAAVDNALRTLLAFSSLDPKNGGGTRGVETRSHAGASVVALGGSTPFAYAVHDGRVVLGTTADAVARALAAQGDASAGGRFEGLRETFFPGSSAYACIDLRALVGVADAHRAALTSRTAARRKRPEAEVSVDVAQAVDVARLFDAAYLTIATDPGLKSVHRTFGLAARDPKTPANR